jgi:hypothetical protein
VKPFWNEKLYDLRKKCRAEYRRWGRAKEKCETANFTAIYRTAYQKLSAEFKRCLKEEKNRTWRKFCTENLNKDILAAIRTITTKQHKTGSLTALMTADGKLESDPGKLTRLMASYIIKLDPPSKAEHITTIEYVEKETTERSASNEETPTFHISLAEQTRALDGLKKKSAAGVDQISCELITIAYPAIKHRLLNILNAGLTNNWFPSGWKIARVCIIPKPGKKSYLSPEAYRPISILNTMGKIYERVIHTRLNKIAEEQNWFNNCQHGFRKGSSTETAAHSLISHIEENFKQKNIQRRPSWTSNQPLITPGARQFCQP